MEAMIDIMKLRKKAIKDYCLSCQRKHKRECIYKHSIDFRREKPCNHIEKPKKKKLSKRAEVDDYFK